MLLAIDIGNTAIKFGLFDGDTLASKFVIPTHREYSANEIKAAVDGRIAGVSDVIVSSVVPELNAAMSSFLKAETGRETRFVLPTDDFGIVVDFATDGTGTDHLLNASAAVELYGAPCIVISFGTATTIDVVNREREHLGGLIAPGPKATAKALELITSKLPDVEIAEPSSIINTSTEGAIQAGIFYSQIGLVETAIPRIKNGIGSDAKVIATGGFAPLFASKCPAIDAVEPDLTLLGLKMLYSRR